MSWRREIDFKKIIANQVNLITLASGFVIAVSNI
jgi:hypothetical protein